MRHLLLCVVLVVGCSGKVDGDKPGEKLTDPSASLTDGQLLGEYEKNAIAADQKYKGKTVKLSGVVTTILPDSIGFRAVEGGGDVSPARYARMSDREKKHFDFGYSPNVLCKIDSANKEAFATATKGKPLTIVGRVVGLTKDEDAYEGRVVILEMCQVAK